MPLSSELGDERRLTVAQGDVFRWLADPPDHLLDVIIIDIDHSPEERLGEESVSFYSTRGLLAAQRHLVQKSRALTNGNGNGLFLILRIT